MKKLMLPVLSAMVVLSGCVSYRTERSAQQMRIPKPETPPIYETEWETGNIPVTGNAEASVLFWFFSSSDSKFADIEGAKFSISPTSRAIHKAKSAATYAALEASGADALLASSYDYKIEDYFFFQKITCTAKGFPAKIKGVSIPKDKPIVLGEGERIERIGANETISSRPQK